MYDKLHERKILGVNLAKITLIYLTIKNPELQKIFFYENQKFNLNLSENIFNFASLFPQLKKISQNFATKFF